MVLISAEGFGGVRNSMHSASIAALLKKSFQFPFNRQHLSYDDCLKVRRENNQKCSVLC